MKTQNLTILTLLIAGLAPLPADDGNDRPPLMGKFTTTFTEIDDADTIDYISEVQECYKAVLDIKDAASAQAGAKGLCDKLQKLAELLKQRQEAIIESMRFINNYGSGIEDDEIAARLLLIHAHMQWLAKQEPAYFGCADLGATWESTLAGQVPDSPRHADDESYTTDSPEVIHITQPLPDFYTFEDANKRRMNAELSALVMAIRGKDVIALRDLAPFIHAYRAHIVDPECYYITHVSPAKDSRKFVTGQTLLYEALVTLDTDVLEAVLDAGVDPDAYIPMGCHIDAHEPYSIRPIHLMAIHPDSWTPVPYSDHEQSVKNMEGLIKILQAHGADINATDDEGRTALHYAAGDHPIDPAVQADVMDMLIRLGADPAAKDASGDTPADCVKEWEEAREKSI